MPFNTTDRFDRQYSRKTPEEQQKVDKTLELLEQDPKHPAFHTHRVQKTNNVWECYIDNSMRITFEYGKGRIILRNNCKHNITERSP